MPKKSKKPDMSLYEPSNKGEALNCMWMGYKYFLTKGWKSALTAVVITGWCLFGPFVFGLKYITSDTVSIEKYSPVSNSFPIDRESLFLRTSMVQHPDHTIVVDGQRYPDHYDPNFVVYVIENTDNLFVYDRRAKEAIKVHAPFLNQQFKK